MKRKLGSLVGLIAAGILLFMLQPCGAADTSTQPFQSVEFAQSVPDVMQTTIMTGEFSLSQVVERACMEVNPDPGCAYAAWSNLGLLLVHESGPNAGMIEYYADKYAVDFSGTSLQIPFMVGDTVVVGATTEIEKYIKQNIIQSTVLYVGAMAKNERSLLVCRGIAYDNCVLYEAKNPKYEWIVYINGTPYDAWQFNEMLQEIGSAYDTYTYFMK
jgi:hypothetical protein